MTALDALLRDLAEESAELDSLVTRLDRAGWATPTPAEGWSVADQISHLAWTDEQALFAVREPERFLAVVAEMLASVDPLAYLDEQAHEGAKADPADLLGRWREGRARLADELARVAPGTRLMWFGPPMSAASMVSARLMETWAHGQDIHDALGVARQPTARLRNVAHVGVRTRDFAFSANNLDAPGEEFHVALTGPDGVVWTWGPEDAAQRVTGSALDFCLRATQRRHRADLDLVAVGPDADRWLDIAQAFAGPPGSGRPAS